MSRLNLFRWIVLWFVAAMTPLLLQHSAGATPCRAPGVDAAALRRAVARLRASAQRPPATSRWTALLPERINWTWRDATQDGVGWYLSPTTGTSSQRGAAGTVVGWSVALRWNLKGLLAPRPNGKQAARVSRRLLPSVRELAAAVRDIARAQSAVVGLQREDPLCRLELGRASAAALVIEATVGVTAKAVLWPPLPQQANALTPARRPVARPGLRSAALPPPGQARPP